LRRVDCAKCGVLTEAVSWAAPRSGFTFPFEDLVGWLAKKTDKTTISELLGVAWRTVGAVLKRAVDRHRAPVDLTKLEAIGIDELSYRKGHHYLTLVTDLQTSRVIWSGEGRSIETLVKFFEWAGAEVCARIRHVAIDMCGAYESAVRDHLPKAELVFDRFHVQQLVGKALDQLRREEWHRAQADGDGSHVKGLRYALLKSPWNLTDQQSQSLAHLQHANKRLYRAYLLKESFVDIYRSLAQPATAKRKVNQWLAWAARSRLKPFVKVAGTIRGHLSGILAYFRTGFTTSKSEGNNTKARLATRRAYGFHSVEAAQAMIELCCGDVRIPLPHVR
jgi:transposase